MATTEERLTALEAKMAQLTATTPTTYYTHQYSGEEIDAAVGRAMNGGALDTSVTNVSNQLGTFVRPNLLDNWYFGNPVNQRGQTEYSENQSYIIDRWRMRGDGVTIGLETDGIVINCDGASFNSIVQAFENPALLLGKTITLSALVTENTNTVDSIIEIGNGVNSSAAGTVLGATRFTGTGLFSVTVNVPSSLTNSYLTSIICAGNPSTNGARFKVAAAKLELGSTQTLAHKDADGNWVLNEIPDYGEQLRRCQRYFVNFNPNRVDWFAMPLAVASNTTQAYSCITLPVAMRAQPVVAYGGNIALSQDADHAVTAIFMSNGTFAGSCVQLGYDVGAGTLTANSSYRVQGRGDPTSYIWLSADL